MSFPPNFLQEIRDRLPLSEVAGKRMRLVRAGREFKGCCPFHNEKSPSFTINDEKQFYHCFGCGAHGDVISFVMQNDRLAFPEAIELLAGTAGLEVPRDTPLDRARFDREKQLYQVLDRAAKWFHDQLFSPAGREALAYLKKRNLSDETLRGFQLGYAPADGRSLIQTLRNDGFKIEDLLEVGLAKKAEARDEVYSFFRHRVIFPVGDRRGRVVAFGGRVLNDGEPKYLNSPDHPLFHKGQLLYGLSRARTAVANQQPLVIVEGYMDVITLVQNGYTGALAPLGTALTEEQMTTLWKLLPPLDGRDPARDYSPVLCFDGDNAGRKAAIRAIERCLPLLTPQQTFRVAFMPKDKDPDDLLREQGRPAMDTVLAEAKPMIEVLWEMTLAERRLETPEDRAALISTIKQKVSRIEHDSLRQLYHDEVQQRLAALFRPETRPQGPQAWQPRVPSRSFVSRTPLAARGVRERVLLALMINHPALFADFGEEFAQAQFEHPPFETLRQKIVEILSLESYEPLDAASLYRHLSDMADSDKSTNHLSSGLKDVLSESTYTHAAFARLGQSLDVVRQGWKSVWNNQVQERLLIDLQAAKRKYASEASEENLSRLLALRQEVELMLQEASQTNPTDIGTVETLQPYTSQD